jgi:hypothetical protein
MPTSHRRPTSISSTVTSGWPRTTADSAMTHELVGFKRKQTSTTLSAVETGRRTPRQWGCLVQGIGCPLRRQSVSLPRSRRRGIVGRFGRLSLGATFDGWLTATRRLMQPGVAVRGPWLPLEPAFARICKPRRDTRPRPALTYPDEGEPTPIFRGRLRWAVIASCLSRRSSWPACCPRG